MSKKQWHTERKESISKLIEEFTFKSTKDIKDKFSPMLLSTRITSSTAFMSCSGLGRFPPST